MRQACTPVPGSLPYTQDNSLAPHLGQHNIQATIFAGMNMEDVSHICGQIKLEYNTFKLFRLLMRGKRGYMRSFLTTILFSTTMLTMTLHPPAFGRISPQSSPMTEDDQMDSSSAVFRQVQCGVLDQTTDTPQDGMLLRNTSGGIAVIYGGAKFFVPNMDVFAAMGYDMANVLEVRDEVLDQIPDIPQDGTLLRDTSGGIGIIYSGVKFVMPNMDVFDALGCDMANAHQVWDGAFDHIPDMLQDGALLRDTSGGIAVIYGGAKFVIPSMDVFTTMSYDMSNVHQMWDEMLDHIPNIPQDGTLLRDTSGGIAVIYGGAKFVIPSMDVFTAMGYDMASVYQVWNEALDAIPDIPREGTRLRETGTDTIYVMSHGIRLEVVPTDLDAVYELWGGALDNIPGP